MTSGAPDHGAHDAARPDTTRPDSTGHDSTGQGAQAPERPGRGGAGGGRDDGLLSVVRLASGSDPKSITLYSGQHPQTTQKLVAAFEKQTGIKVSVRSDDEDVLAAQIVTEGSRSPADVFYTENSPPLEFLQGKGLLSAVHSSTLAATPSKYNSPQGDWVGVSARVSVLIYNPRLISKSQLPTSVMQLADPKYQGKLALAAGETDFQPIVTSVLRAHGAAATVKWLDALKANAAGHLYPDNETVTSDVNKGSAALGIINQYYWYRLRAEIGAGAIHSDIAHFAPHDPGYVVDVSGAAILKSSTAPGRRAAFPGLPGQQAGPGDHRRPFTQLRVPDSLRRDHRRPGNPVQPAPAELHHDRRARHRVSGRHPAPPGRPAVTPGRPRPGGYR